MAEQTAQDRPQGGGGLGPSRRRNLMEVRVRKQAATYPLAVQLKALEEMRDLVDRSILYVQDQLDRADG